MRPVVTVITQPLASILGDFTEEVSAHTNQTLGGLIQATLGNAVEIVVAIQALYANQIRVVQVLYMMLLLPSRDAVSPR